MFAPSFTVNSSLASISPKEPPGKFKPDGEMPQMPEGEPSQKPDGEMLQPPQRPDGERPMRPEGGTPDFPGGSFGEMEAKEEFTVKEGANMFLIMK